MHSDALVAPAALHLRRIMPAALALGGAVALGLAVIWAALRPPSDELRDVAGLLGASAVVSLVAYGLLTRYLPSRPLAGPGGRIALVAAFGGALALVNVAITAGFMFLSGHDLTLLAALMLFALLISSLAAVAVARSIADPIVRLIEAVDQLPGDQFAVHVRTQGDDELARLGEAFNAMAARLRDAAGQRDRAESSRRELVAAISHDLRTPISSARLMVEAIEDELLDESTQQRYLVGIKLELILLDRLIDDLFEHSRIEAGVLTLDRTATNMDVLVAESVEHVRAQAERNQIRLRTEIAPDLPLVYADPWCLQRALRNLLDNAVRYTPARGDIAIAAQSRGDFVELAISDTGPGISEEDSRQVFTPFFRGDPARQRNGGGAGLGLAIARGIVEAHSGRLALDQGASVGATFRITLPLDGGATPRPR